MMIGSYPTTRLRRMRQRSWIRDLVSDVRLVPSDLVQPIFIRTEDTSPDIDHLPGIRRYTVAELLPYVESALKQGVRAFALFPCTPPHLKTEDGAEALNPKNLICQGIQALKKHFQSDIGVISDIALDPYTQHGHDGVLENIHGMWQIHNDATIAVLTQQAQLYASMGADCVAPSDMMDGRVGAIRHALDEMDMSHVMILSYAAKYATSFYGPFRSAVGAGVLSQHSEPELHHKKTYQMDDRRADEALHTVAQNLHEGADMIMIKPALLHLDTIHRIRTTFQCPTFAYHVSGEFACLKYAARAGALDYGAALLEVLRSLKRAGCHGIVTYGALDAAHLLNGGSYS